MLKPLRKWRVYPILTASKSLGLVYRLRKWRNVAEEETESETEETEPLEKPEETSEKGLGDFVSVSMRGPKRGIYEQLLAQLLIKSNRTNYDLIKIISLCEAALMSRQKDKLDMNHVGVCYAVSRSFLNTKPDPNMKDVVRVAWSFPKIEENWEKYIDPWHRATVPYYPLETRHRKKNYPHKWRYSNYTSPWEARVKANEYLDYKDGLTKKVYEEMGELPIYDQFFQTTGALSTEGYQILEGEFAGWALRQLSEIKAQIAQEISPQVWREALGVFGEKREEEE